MKNIKVPESGRKRALIVVDLQPRFVNDRMLYIVGHIEKLLSQVPYDLYFEALFFAEEDSIWKKQANWFAPKKDNMMTVSPVGEKLKELNSVEVIKSVRSAFKGEPVISDILREQEVEEVHIVGLDTYDCITATAHESHDLGFFTYIIEECCQATTNQDLHERAVLNLRQTKLTNNSCIEEIKFIEIL